MKKVLIMLGAVLSFGIASAQTDPKQPPQTPATPAAPVSPDTPIDVDKKDPNAQTTVIEKSLKRDEVQPRKAELKTRDHVKSTPDPDRVRDTVKTQRKTNRTKKG